jgi:hypothetical protein
MAGDEHHPRSTLEVVALWNDAVEEHLTRQLAQSLPGLVGGEQPMDSARAAVLARHLIHALRLTAQSGDAAVAVRYLADAALPGDQGVAPRALG